MTPGFARAALVAILFASPAASDDVFHDYQLGQKIAAGCLASAESMEEATSCVGMAMRECLDPASNFPWNPTRDCAWRGERHIWEDIYQAEVIRKLDWARKFDAWQLSVDSVSEALTTVMEGELAWRDYAYAYCALVDLPDADKSYDYRRANDPQCMARMFAERAFQLRSLTKLEP